ncbi:MAG: MarR family transcriptional regulator [Nitrospinae bacterium]|nr:MarR family transcriptional regulator [Nitrospinota bacterium]
MSFNLDESLGFLLNRAAHSMKWALEKKLARHGLTPPQWASLARLWEEDGLPQSQLGRRLHFDKPTISGIIDRLETKGLVRRERDGEDKRVVRIFLAPKGKKLEKTLAGLATGVNQKAGAGLSPAGLENLKAMLTRIFTNMRE